VPELSLGGAGQLLAGRSVTGLDLQRRAGGRGGRGGTPVAVDPQGSGVTVGDGLGRFESELLGHGLVAGVELERLAGRRPAFGQVQALGGEGEVGGLAARALAGDAFRFAVPGPGDLLGSPVFPVTSSVLPEASCFRARVAFTSAPDSAVYSFTSEVRAPGPEAPAP
jgi:hypothetical protein